jgi:hypothetical protein
MAITFDAANDGGFTTSTFLTWSHTCTGANRCLNIGTLGDLTNDTITSAAYNGVAATKITSIQVPSDRWIQAWRLLSPATGANTVRISSSGSTFMHGQSVSYAGVGSVESGIATVSASPAVGITATITTVAANCWTSAFFANDGGLDVTARSGTTLRLHTATDGQSAGDSNVALAAGSHTLGVTASAAQWGAIILSLAPAVAGSSVGWGMLYQTDRNRQISSR